MTGATRVTVAVWRKDTLSLWASPIPWVVGALLHVVLGLLYVGELQDRGQALIQPLFPLAGFLLLVAVPALTMRSFAEEARTGTLDLLQAVPAPTGSLVLGKWLAAWTSALALVAPAAASVVVLVLYGQPDPGPVVAGFAGLALFTAAVAAVGVLASSLTASQPVAALLAFFVGLLLWFAHADSAARVSGPLLTALSLSERLRGFAAGVLDAGDTGFFVVLTAVALIAAAVALDARRLR